MIPAPIPPAVTPKPARPRSTLLRMALVSIFPPNWTAAHGLTYPSARATAGAERVAAVADATSSLNTLRICTRSWLVVHDERHERWVDLETVFVLDEAQPLELVHEQVHARSRGPHHFRDDLL